MSKFNRMTTEKANQAMQEQLEAIDGGGKQRVSLKDGMNVFYILPAVGQMTYPLQFMHIHYRPFHVCLRALAYDSSTSKTVPVKKFDVCPRCIGAWNERSKHIGSDDKDSKQFSPLQTAAQAKFKSDMPSERVVAQVVDVTSFFKMVDGEPEPQPSMLNAYFEEFLDVMSGSEPSEKMPEEMVNAAIAGPCPLALNVDVGKRVDSVYRRAMKESKSDPAFMPEAFLIFIKKTFDKEEGGIKKYTYDVARVSEKIMVNEGWAGMMQAHGPRFMEIIGERAIDMVAPDRTDDLIQDAFNLVKFSKDEMMALLKQANHSFEMKTETVEGESMSIPTQVRQGSPFIQPPAEEIEVEPIKAQDLSASREAFQRKRKQKAEDADAD